MLTTLAGDATQTHLGVELPTSDPEMIEAIEAEGWQLTQWAVSTDAKGRPQAYPLFRSSGRGL